MDVVPRGTWVKLGAVAGGAAAYLGMARSNLPVSWAWGITLVWVVAIVVWSRRVEVTLATLGVLGASVPIFVVLRATTWSEQATLWPRHVAGLAVLSGVLLPAWLPRVKPTGDQLVAPPGPAERSLWAAIHGPILVAAAAMFPLGEGAGFVAGGACLALVFARRVSWAHAWSPTVVRWVALAFAVFVVVGLGAVATSGEGFLRVRDLSRLGPWYVLPAAYLSVRFLPARWARRAAQSFVLLLVVSSLFGVAQYIFDLSVSEGLSGLMSSISSRAQTHVPGHADRTVAAGFYFHRLKMGHVLLLGIGVLTAHQIFGSPSRKRRALSAVALGVLVLALFLTFARAAWMGCAAGALACVVFAPKPWRIAAIVGVLLGVGVGLGTPPVRERLLSVFTKSEAGERPVIWAQGVTLMSDYPWGTGMANYPSLVTERYRALDPNVPWPKAYAHNIVLSAWAETGPFGLLGYLLFWSALGAACIAGVRTRDGPTRVAGGAGVFCLAALWTVGMTHDVMFHDAVALSFAAVMGAILGIVAPRGRSVS